jgi:hypothetical protein
MTKSISATLPEKVEVVEVKPEKLLMDHGPCIETAMGNIFNFLEPTAEQISIVDIAHSLANQCRFTGHTREFYSVAEHSMLVARLVRNPEHKMIALLHDASEAYLTDIATPVKAHLSNYRELEATIWKAVASKYNLPETLPEEVKLADRQALYIEAGQLIPSCGENWENYEAMQYDLPDIALECLAPKDARMLFLVAFNNYGGEPYFDFDKFVHTSHLHMVGVKNASVAA